MGGQAFRNKVKVGWRARFGDLLERQGLRKRTDITGVLGRGEPTVEVEFVRNASGKCAIGFDERPPIDSESDEWSLTKGST